MNSFKGTKGKWVKTTKHTSKNAYIVVQVVHENGYKQVLFEYRISQDECLQTCCNKEQHANAKLIACAPEMLEMLELLIDRMEENDLGNFSAVQRAKQLIKKATE